jgi:hypothetical protein
MYADFPIQGENPNLTKKVLDGSRDSMLANHKDSVLLAEHEIILDGAVGRELLIADGDVIIRERSFFIKGRLYQTLLGAQRNVVFKTGQSSPNPQDRTESYEALAAKFLGSFKLLPARR